MIREVRFGPRRAAGKARRASILGILLILLTQVTPTSCGLLATRVAAVLDEPSVRHGLHGNGLLNEPEEQLGYIRVSQLTNCAHKAVS